MKVTDSVQCDTWYQALLARAPEYTGVFYVGVKTTGVFCIAVCRARKPKRENVEFYRDFKSALDAGYRPCKVCRPTENACSAPDYIEQALALVRQTPKVRISDARLRDSNISPERVRRWFLQHHGITFQAFQRMQRVNVALQELKGGRSATDVAFDSGYESLSGFGYTYKKLTGHSPTMAQQTLLIHRFTTPIGPMFVCASERGVCLLEFVDRRMLETEFSDLQRLLNARIIAGQNEHIRQAENEIAEYFAGKRLRFTLALDTPGSEFQRRVWQALAEIPCGESTHYQALAETLNKPTAARAVAAANGANRIALVIPCHRVIGKDGSMTGYGGGVARKRWLLEHEKKIVAR
ncbi:TPA: methylated-DNA--[protein]-cysteine S-methyltransferase [Kluyvera ascorbata]|uniref:Methylated-DNA--protein-cysteine methyltransferase n=1 Tax=Kluyvera ascorbata TaxID=51288 RepID=A0A3N2RVV6_9ENTR|nr:methylated-DNA--[protein]-cysteine S-methyltransferase [Kluyvera ascorbata]BBV65803.1 XRE family transcriptional regulator [Klebsiella sp. STW0522-44]MDU3910603.1 methylated-DNA--[protein]-cysteine S-methyltransferase [Kluyvera ascorbata]ROU11589.1 methylated-DNA--[protein]-cysteine S-methyltransferase [Kluyvera ascorbata]HAT7513962.1 methylated-DNA--[protein]-cysteine S-methyltransferase [Kluyvera ascorbata]HCL5619488.1 methylated-DNA--[protein]-cysteine S-methyltransferase [Kluyvera ascor